MTTVTSLQTGTFRLRVYVFMQCLKVYGLILDTAQDAVDEKYRLGLLFGREVTVSDVELELGIAPQLEGSQFGEVTISHVHLEVR